MKEVPPYSHKEHICPICNKVFIPSAYHIYKVKNTMLCSYSCRNRYLKENPIKNYNYIERWGK